MAFIQNAGANVIGGVVGGLVVLFAIGFWYKFRTFKLRYLNPEESLTAENMRQYTAIRMDVGEYVTRISIRPRQGMILDAIGIAFFDCGLLPWKAGRRRSNRDILANSLRYFDDNDSWITPEFKVKKEYSVVELPKLRFDSHSRRIFEITFNVTDAVKSWQGVLGFQMFFTRGGDPDRKNINTKCIIYAPEKKRPFRAIGKRILRCPLKNGVEYGD